MALKVDYVAKETTKNLVRNPWLTIATILCVFVSIAMVGAALLTRTAVGHATQRWQGGVELIVFMNPDATQAQIDTVDQALADHPLVRDSTFLDKQAAYDEFAQLFDDSPELVESVTPDDLPTNFKVRPTRVDSDVIESLRQTFQTQPGVLKVVAADDTIRAIERISNVFSVGLLSVAVALTVAALVLIGNTIQTAIYARRHEIEVMKLVGATNWFIRVPFMLEGLVQGLLGSLAGIGGVYGLRWAFSRYITSEQDVALLGSFTVSGSDVFGTALLLLLGGVLIGAIASAVAVTFYVDV